MLSKLTRNVRTFLWALILALAVWVSAVNAADPDQVSVYPSPVKVEVVGQNPGLVITGNVPQEVEVTLRAPQSVWRQLRAGPNGVRAVLDLSGLSTGLHKLGIQLQVDERPVRIVTVSPDSVSLTLEPLITRSLPLQATLAGKTAIGYEAGDLLLDPKQISLAGPQSIVSQVTHVQVVINVSGTHESIDESIPVDALDQNNAKVTGLSVQPNMAHITLPVIRQGGFRDVAVKVIVRGVQASGYRVDSISVSPPVVTVYSSDPALVNALPGAVETEPLDLQDANDNLNTRLSLNLPPGISVVGEQTVLIQAGISPIQSSVTLSGEKVEVTGLPTNLTAQISPLTLDVILSGPLPILSTLTRQDVHVKVDVTGLGAGSYQLTPSVQILASSVTVESLLPGTVEVVLVPSTSPTTKP